MELVGIYNRCSTEEEAQVNALAVQAAESLEIVQSMEGWCLAEQYIETQSGTGTQNRPEYLRMLREIEQGRFTVIVIKSIDRLVRNTRDWYLFLDCIARNHVKLYLYLERKFYTPDDSLVIGIKAILAEEFSRELSKKIKNAHNRRQNKRSGLNISREMFGWDKVGKDIYKINEREADAYRRAFGLAEAGFGFRKISKTLYEAGVRGKQGNRITEVQWRNMLRSPRACGTVVLHKYEYDFELKRRIPIPEEEWIFVEDALPAIVDKAYQERVLKVLDLRSARGKGEYRRLGKNVGKYLLSGKLVCGICGGIYYRSPSRKNGEMWEDWRCSTGVSGGGCRNIRVDEPALYRLMDETYKSCLGGAEVDEKWILEDIEEILHEVLEVGKTEEVLKRLRKRQSVLARKMDVLLDKLIDGVISDRDYHRGYERMQRELGEIEKKLRECMEQCAGHGEAGEGRMEKIIPLLKEGMINRAIVMERLERVERIMVFPDGELRVLDGERQFSMRYVRETAGKYLRRRQREQILQYLNEHGSGSVSQLSYRSELKPCTVYSRLRELRERGLVKYSAEDGGHWEPALK